METIYERVISVYDMRTDALIREIGINSLFHSILFEIFEPKKEDPDLFRCYEINNGQFTRLGEFVPEIKNFPPTEFSLYLESYASK